MTHQGARLYVEVEIRDTIRVDAAAWQAHYECADSPEEIARQAAGRYMRAGRDDLADDGLLIREPEGGR